MRSPVFVATAILLGSLAIGGGAGTSIAAPGQGDPGMSGATVTNMASGEWSNPAIWSTGQVPGEGDQVVIAHGSAVVYDVQSQKTLAGLEVQGTLAFSRRTSTSMDVGLVLVHKGGALELGTPQEPLPGSVTATIRFAGPQDDRRGLEIMGRGEIHGAPLRYTFTRLDADAPRGTRSIRVKDPVDWKVGDHLVIASTTHSQGETEEAVVAGVSGVKLTLRQPLRFSHSGVAPTRAHVANLSRNIVFTSKDVSQRGHTLYHYGAQGSISYAEYAHLGQEKRLGRYPVHYHMAQDSMQGSSIKGVSVWDSANRFITVHSTQYVTLSDNVGYKAIGHGFFMEIGDEVFVTWERNLGITVLKGELTPGDQSPAIFWVQNPHNSYVNNVAVGSRGGSGFDFSLPSQPLDIKPIGKNQRPRDFNVLRFAGNEAYGNTYYGVRTYVLNDRSRANASLFEGMIAWRNDHGAFSIRGNKAQIVNAYVFGNRRTDVLFMGNDNALLSSQVLGELPQVAADANLLRSLPPTLRGVVLQGQRNVVDNSTITGHLSNEGATGVDVTLGQSEEMLSTALVINSVLGSKRPVIFGYPAFEKSYLVVQNTQTPNGRLDSALLYRIDAEAPPLGCADSPSLDGSLVAARCAFAGWEAFPGRR